MAQLVEHNLAKVGVAGSNPVVRSNCSSDESARTGALVLSGTSYGFREKAHSTVAHGPDADCR